ncbi:MAG TPA: hypothetical protein VKP13_09570 [Nitrospira sp.]|nr:hypothetical protein [Nitrospira sp.]
MDDRPIRVTNRNNRFDVRDKFAGQEYRFPAGETVVVPREAAEHIFGYGMDEQARFRKLMRMGWANHKDGRKWWSNIHMEPVGGNQSTGAAC